MKGLVLQAATLDSLEAFQAAPTHALLLAGPTGSGKHTLARSLTEALLGLAPDGFAKHPYALLVGPEEPGKAIGIEAVRQLEQFLSLKVPGAAPGYDRAVVIDGAQLMTHEAQNALLKLLEEPPAGTVLILTASHEQTLLPTIRSRAQTVRISPPEKDALLKHFTVMGSDVDAVNRAYAISGGLPGLMHALLNDESHPLTEAAGLARELLSKTAYERLGMVDELAKDRPLAVDTTAMLQQMAHIGLQNASGQAARKWRSVLKAAYEAGEDLAANVQPKLALTKLMLNL